MSTPKIPSDMTYAEAMAIVRQHIADIEAIDDDLDLLVKKTKQAKAYLKYCEAKIYQAESTFNDIFSEEE